MSVEERKRRERAERESAIVAAARALAEADGWNAVTIRRLAEKIEYSQPVLYSHFENRDAIVAAVALEGFGELALALRKAVKRARDHQDALTCLAGAYLAFARKRPAVYEAMFAMPTDLRFAQAESKPELKEAFAALKDVVAQSTADAEAATETFWASLHGLADLERTGRIRQGAREKRVALVVNGMLA
ncbi:TetR/AcrR family transcriptional regulator [Bradyrhizobium sp. BR 10289]|uniref:TetR/AcrR family transcriptional regulator n=1 Tax=Bradyrhizobium sp. BR 10289 TaxID=2749993 RepID=UPI001C6548D2|nr:TetR/AcrR family transcriptional regulator [Bradyrhizobium sp. BR 10289]MBW7970214.1 WHG domain-containing protein [Bradyrhizobium sp. BR 10289]